MAEAPRQIVIRNDTGGAVDAYAARIDRYRAEGREVRIEGKCASACTMYLAVGCVTPQAELYFHGPMSQCYGIALPTAEFEDCSRQIASYYPEPLRSWYLREGRNITVGFTRLTGTQLVGLGARRCD